MQRVVRRVHEYGFSACMLVHIQKSHYLTFFLEHNCINQLFQSGYLRHKPLIRVVVASVQVSPNERSSVVAKDGTVRIYHRDNLEH